jgi:DNA-binding HxlR family transcriptional regulator
MTTAHRSRPTPASLPDGAWDGKLLPFLGLFDVLGRRWSLRLVWELRHGPASFRELRDRAGGMSSSVLNDRLRDLRQAGVVDHVPGEGYALTEMGAGLADRIVDIYLWLHDEHGMGHPPA